MLHELAYDTCKRDWPVVSRVVLLAFRDYGCNVCVPPVCWNNACCQPFQSPAQTLLLCVLPFLNMGVTYDWKIMVRAGASSSASSLKTRELMPSGPLALYGLRFSMSFFTRCSDILISSIVGMPLSAIPVFSSNSSAVYCLPSPKTD